MDAFYFFFKLSMVFFSAGAVFLSFIFTFYPKRFLEMEKVLELEFGSGEKMVTVLEGEIDFLNIWVTRNRYIFGPLFIILGAFNTWSAFFY